MFKLLFCTLGVLQDIVFVISSFIREANSSFIAGEDIAMVIAVMVSSVDVPTMLGTVLGATEGV